LDTDIPVLGEDKFVVNIVNDSLLGGLFDELENQSKVKITVNKFALL